MTALKSEIIMKCVVLCPVVCLHINSMKRPMLFESGVQSIIGVVVTVSGEIIERR